MTLFLEIDFTHLSWRLIITLFSKGRICIVLIKGQCSRCELSGRWGGPGTGREGDRTRNDLPYVFQLPLSGAPSSWPVFQTAYISIIISLLPSSIGDWSWDNLAGPAALTPPPQLIETLSPVVPWRCWLLWWLGGTPTEEREACTYKLSQGIYSSCTTSCSPISVSAGGGPILDNKANSWPEVKGSSGQAMMKGKGLMQSHWFLKGNKNLWGKLALLF